MATTYEKIATTTLGSAASTITFSSISSAYTDLKVVVTALAAGDYSWLDIRFNSDSGTNYSRTFIRGDGSTASSGRRTSDNQINVSPDGIGGSTNPAFYEIDIFSYAGSTYKTALISASGDQNGSGQVLRTVGLWRNTAAITTLGLISGNFNFASGTSATIYGILKA
jgi:hypothetical protein